MIAGTLFLAILAEHSASLAVSDHFRQNIIFPRKYTLGFLWNVNGKVIVEVQSLTMIMKKETKSTMKLGVDKMSKKCPK